MSIALAILLPFAAFTVLIAVSLIIIAREEGSQL